MKLASFLKLLFSKNLQKGPSGHWWSQRMSAILLIVFGGWFLISMTLIDSYHFESIYNWVSVPFNILMLSLLVTLLTYHSYLGLEVIIEDYVHDNLQQLSSLRLSKIIHFVVFLLSVSSLGLIFLGLFNG
ncbi:MAG: succinate dehydrogenase, hydrophobic membrane anchor protein [Woeseiaceae bacterium]|jgi:succinate dehydrogenase / fumarate reductase, membrane anchor subunit|nr:succinate dehydrogenase, hydrophobic membrane anchor protein [Woeseiaceae bacterium]MDG1015250.1 succinate dehydrogenase, hydrophobic membrane anchor protein [Woeseiaceae bacterium]MDG1866123.1 succinate dehydrogenase, hydrophobic membrane anchor protein [Woeseiaceae bacterium]|tara:strand:- start:6326 stop:6715 length:390 start_codon:yes stop_codon:yes gene_type:complete